MSTPQPLEIQKSPVSKPAFSSPSELHEMTPTSAIQVPDGNVSDLDDSEPESDNGLSPILDALTVCSSLICSKYWSETILVRLQTIPIPQNPVDVKDLIKQAHTQRKSALYKRKLADAKLREALLKAKLCRARAHHAKQTLEAANVYLTHVHWTVERSKFKHVLSPRVMTITDGGVLGTQGMYITLSGDKSY